MKSRWVATILLFLVAAVVPASATTPEDVANDISMQVMSPFCPGVTLHDCPSQAAIDLREDIEEWARDGLTRAQILERLEDDFGTNVRAAPPVDGSGVGAWVVPALAAVGGGVIAAALARRWGRGSTRGDDHEAEEQVTPADRRRLERELRAFRGENV